MNLQTRLNAILQFGDFLGKNDQHRRTLNGHQEIWKIIFSSSLPSVSVAENSYLLAQSTLCCLGKCISSKMVKH